MRFCVEHPLSIEIAQKILEGPDKCWQPALSADGAELRDHAEVAEITDRVDLSPWPEGTRMIARSELPHPGAQLTFCDTAGRCLQVLIMCAHDLLAWTRQLALDGDLAKAEPKRLRYCLLHTAGRLVRTSWQQVCNSQTTGPGQPTSSPRSHGSTTSP